MPLPITFTFRHLTRFWWPAATLACLVFSSVPSRAEPGAIPFQKGERLSFQISWGFIPAAHATLEVAADSAPEAGAAYHFIMTARTLPAIDLIYKYRERVDSWVAAGVHHTLQYQKVQEGSHPREIVVRFDWNKQTAQSANFGKLSLPIPIRPETLDPLSALYYIRTQPLANQATLTQWVTDGKKLSRGVAVVRKRETITIRGQRYRTIKIEPDLREVKGVFEQSPGAKMVIWLTDDDRKLLVKLRSKVRVGSFVAELIEEESVIPGVTDQGSGGGGQTPEEEAGLGKNLSPPTDQGS